MASEHFLPKSMFYKKDIKSVLIKPTGFHTFWNNHHSDPEFIKKLRTDGGELESNHCPVNWDPVKGILHLTVGIQVGATRF